MSRTRHIIDITQLYNWQGKLTGIPRVMYEISRRYQQEHGNAVTFVCWNPSYGYFYEVDWHAAAAEYDAASGAPDSGIDHTETIGKRSLPYRAVRKLYRHIPSSVKHRVRALRDNMNQPIKAAQMEQPAPLEFHDTDTLLVMWGEWGDPGYRAFLVAMVREHGVRLVQAAHDMIPILLPQFSGHSTEALTAYAREIYPICDLIVCNSKNTRDDVRQWLVAQRLQVPRLEVIRLGDDFAAISEKKPNHAYFDKNRTYVLTVGTIEARKNHAILYYSYRLAVSRGIELPDLVIVGRNGWMTENIYEYMTKDPLVKDKFIFVHDADDSQLSWAINHARFTIYPSFYEGWGLPIAESAMRGVPCIASSSSSMPEVIGDAARYFNPASTDECLAAIQDMMKSSVYNEMKQRVGRYRPTTWDSTYKQLKEYIKHD